MADTYKEHILDLVIVREDDVQNWINLNVTQSSISDHFSVLYALSIDKIDHSPSLQSVIQYRNFKSIDQQCSPWT